MKFERCTKKDGVKRRADEERVASPRGGDSNDVIIANDAAFYARRVQHSGMAEAEVERPFRRS